MISFKEQLNKDLGVFINFDEFGTEHIINKKPVICVVDEDIFEERPSNKADSTFEGVFVKTKSIFIKIADIKKPSIQERLVMDGNYYLVTDVIETEYMYEIQIARNDY